jgi:AraC-like DNA-binding protein
MVDTAVFDPDAVRRADRSTLVHEHATWQSVRANLIRRTGLRRQETKIAASDHTILLNIRGIAKEGEDYLNGRRVGFVRRPPGSLSFIPADHAWTGWDDGDPTASYLFITVDKTFVLGLLEKLPGSHLERLVPDLVFQDSSIQFAARCIGSEIKHRDPAGALMVESQAASIIAQLLRRYGNPRELSKGGLAPTVLKRAVERIEESLERSISLTELAKEADLSVAHFCRAFRQSTGWPPHAFLSRRRLERATELLRSSDMSITEIALACGYSSGSHLSTAFHREIGTPPKLYRSVWKR